MIGTNQLIIIGVIGVALFGGAIVKKMFKNVKSVKKEIEDFNKN